MKRSICSGLAFLLVACVAPPPARSKGDDFNAVVKIIEQSYQVKHQKLPFLARAGIKTAKTAARIAGGSKRKIAEAGSIKLAFFEDQDFSAERMNDFRTSLNAAMITTWTPLIQVFSGKDHNQSYIFLRNVGEKFNVLVVGIENREAWVVQVDIKPAILAELLQAPDEMGKAIADDAMIDDQE
jgi:hypothetical protein